MLSTAAGNQRTTDIPNRDNTAGLRGHAWGPINTRLSKKFQIF